MYPFYVFIPLFFLFQFVTLNSANERQENEGSSRLIDAELAESNQFPFIVRIYIQLIIDIGIPDLNGGNLDKSEAKTYGKITCTGTIIDHDTILTSGFCIKTNSLPYGDIYVVHGSSDQSSVNPTELWNGICPKNLHCYKAHTLLAHPNLDLVAMKNNVGIIKLQEPMPKSDGHKVFDCSSVGTGPSKSCTLIGFNDDKEDGRMRYKTGIATKFCHEDSLCLTENHLCNGDFGGPLICDNWIYGVVSNLLPKKGVEVKGCSDIGENVYTALSSSSVRDFLSQNTPCKSFPKHRPVMQGSPSPNKPNSNNPEPHKPDPNKPEPNKPNSNNPEPHKPDSNKPEPNKPNPNNPEPHKPDSNKPEPNKPNPNQPSPSEQNPNQPESKKPDSSKEKEKSGETIVRKNEFLILLSCLISVTYVSYFELKI